MAGTKRTFNQTVHEEFAGRKHQSSHLSLNNYVPLLVFIRNKFMEGISRAVAQQMFEEIVMRRSEACIYENGQWHVPDYGGHRSSCGHNRRERLRVKAHCDRHSHW